jgi:hypothetical protein
MEAAQDNEIGCAGGRRLPRRTVEARSQCRGCRHETIRPLNSPARASSEDTPADQSVFK